MAFMVRASRATSSPERGTGTRRSSVVPVMDSTSTRIDSTGRSDRPASTQASRPTAPTSKGKDTARPSCTASTLWRTGSSGEAARSCTSPSGLSTASWVTTRWPDGRLVVYPMDLPGSTWEMSPSGVSVYRGGMPASAAEPATTWPSITTWMYVPPGVWKFSVPTGRPASMAWR